ncbi:MAG: serine/threonine protein kinase [Planctomycetaceae bacterium]|jgi:serine/threonine protein kinase|nr:serine/threonine protein kinase [Planctomycetaceae bacterium]
MLDFSIEDLIKRTLDVGILTHEQVNEIRSEFSMRQITPDQFIQSALRRGWLTNYQIDRLKSGDIKGFYFGNYKALYLVGAGSFARVFRAVHRVTGRVAAVKVLRARHSENENFVRHFLQEAKIVSELKHKNIVPVYGAESIGFLHYMAMEFVEGQTLREFLKVRKKVEAITVVRIAIDVCNALDYAIKTQNLQHRDLKLSNVILSSTGQAKLVDFGLSSVTQSAENDSGAPDLKNQQSIDYIALERAAGGKKMDERSDLYFLGCIMYQLLCGESPFTETKDRTQRLERTRFFNVQPLHQVDETIPAAVSFLVNKSLSVNADQRYQNTTDMLKDLNSLLKRIEIEKKADSATSLSFENFEAMQKDREERLQKLEKATVMVIDSNPKLQKSLENLMIKLGYNAVSIDDPDKMIQYFEENDLVAQCVIFNGQSLGIRAVRAFNDFAQRRGLRDVAAILILDQDQTEWEDSVTPQHHRVILTMPVTVKQFKTALTWLLEGFGKNI